MDGQRESLPLLVFRIAVNRPGLATRCLHRLVTGTSQPWRRATDIVVDAAVPVVLIAVSLINQPAVFEVDEQPAAVCTQRRDIRYCVHTTSNRAWRRWSTVWTR